MLDVETVTVPAGTYSALKLQSVETWTNAAGTTYTDTITNWRDINTLYSVQETITRVLGGTLPANGDAVSIQTVLQSAN